MNVIQLQYVKYKNKFTYYGIEQRLKHELPNMAQSSTKQVNQVSTMFVSHSPYSKVNRWDQDSKNSLDVI